MYFFSNQISLYVPLFSFFLPFLPLPFFPAIYSVSIGPACRHLCGFPRHCQAAKEMALTQITGVWESDCYGPELPGQDNCRVQSVTYVLFFVSGWRGECWENWSDYCHCWHGGVPHMWHLAGQDQNLQVRYLYKTRFNCVCLFMCLYTLKGKKCSL